MFEKTIFIRNISDYSFNFKKLLEPSNTLTIINCNNLNIKVKSKINKILLQNCSNINIKISNMISGIEIDNSKDINIEIYKNKKINSLGLFNSNIKINKLNYELINENSFIKLQKIE